MVRAIVFTVIGLVIGVGGTLLVSRGAPPALAPSPAVTPSHSVVSCDQETVPLRARIAELEARVTRQAISPAAAGGEEIAPSQASETAAPTDDSEERAREVVTWRVSAIEKFVPLSEEQKGRLSAKFQREWEARAKGENAETESLEAILGQESADYYRGQVKAAFDRVQNEETDKEVVWLARQLSLSAEQERATRAVFLSVEQRIDQEFSDPQHGATRTSQDRVKQMIAENRRRAQLRAEELQKVLSPEQYQAYVRSEAESSSADVEVFHDPGQ